MPHAKNENRVENLLPDGYLEVFIRDQMDEEPLRFYFNEEGFKRWAIEGPSDPMPGSIKIIYDDRIIRIPRGAFSLFVTHKNSSAYDMEHLKAEVKEKIKETRATNHSVFHSTTDPDERWTGVPSYAMLSDSLRKMAAREIAYPHFIVLSEELS